MKRISKSKQVATLLGASLLMLTACVPDAPTRGGAAQPTSIERSSDDGSASNSNAAPGAASNANEAGAQTVTQPVAASAAQSTFASPLPTPTLQPQNEIEFTGTVEVIASDMWVVGGRTVAVTAATEIKPGLAIGVLAKVHAVPQANGSLWAREIEPAADDDGNGNSNDNGNGNSNDDNGNGNVNSNDDHGNSNSNDDNGNDDNGNGNVNSNDDHGNDDNGNGNVNSNDDHGNDDNGNSNDDHGNDDGGNSNDDNDDGGNDNGNGG